MGDENDQSEEISNNKLLEAILDMQKNLDKNTKCYQDRQQLRRDKATTK